MTKCYICNRKGSKLSNLSFHRFPNDEESRQKWLEIIGKCNPLPVKRSTVCSLHFTEDCFRYGLVYGMRRLKEGSNPSLYLEEKPEETIMLNKLHTTSVSQTVDEVVNEFRAANSDQDNSDENSDSSKTPKSKLQRSKNYKRKVKESIEKEFNFSKKRIKFNLPWEKIISAPDGGKKYWEHAQRELIARKKRIRSLEITLRRTKQKLLDVQTSIKDLKENPYIAVYVQNDK